MVVATVAATLMDDDREELIGVIRVISISLWEGGNITVKAILMQQSVFHKLNFKFPKYLFTKGS